MAVILAHLCKTFIGPEKETVHAVRDFSLVIKDKEFLVLVGPSGCGKSTLLRTIAGLEEPSGGTISIGGLPMDGVPAKDRDVAMVFQNYALYPHMSVFENMAFGLKLRKHASADIDKRVREAAEILGLMPLLNRLPNALSGGERQRVALGRALVRKPKVLLLDEPLSNLDATFRSQMRLELAKLHARLEATMLYVTHDQVEAMTLGQRIAVMNKGTIQQVGEPMDVYRRPGNLFVAGFIGSPQMNFFPGELGGLGGENWFSAQLSGGNPGSQNLRVRWPAHLKSNAGSGAGRPVVIGIRPEDIGVQATVENSGANCGKDASAVQATVEAIEPRGPETYLHLAAGSHHFVARVHPDFQVRIRQPVFAAFSGDKSRFFDSATGEAFD